MPTKQDNPKNSAQPISAYPPNDYAAYINHAIELGGHLSQPTHQSLFKSIVEANKAATIGAYKPESLCDTMARSKA